MLPKLLNSFPRPDLRDLPEALEAAVVRLLLKKTPTSVDSMVLANCCPVSNYLGKVVERTVAEQLQVFLDNASLMDTF